MVDTNSEEKKVGICVRCGKTGVEPSTHFTLIWGAQHGLVALLDKKLQKGTWVTFTVSQVTAEIQCIERPLADNVEEDEVDRRRVLPIGKTIQLLVVVTTFRDFNDYFGLGKDAQLGWVLVPRDPYLINRLRNKQSIKVVVVFKEDCVQGFHWVAVAASEMSQDNENYFWKFANLPRFLDDLAATRYLGRAKLFEERNKLRNPLLALFAEEGPMDKEEMPKRMTDEFRFGKRFGFTKDYEPDVNGLKFRLTCLVVYVHEKAALVYNKQYQIGIIRNIDFDSHAKFENVCKLGNWIEGIFTRPYLARQYQLQYSFMPAKNHRIKQIGAPSGVQTRIRHFRGYYQFNAPEKIVMIKVHCHFTPQNLKRTRKGFVQGAGGMFVYAPFGKVFLDYSVYADGKFEGKHVALWVCCLPNYMHLLAELNCFWHFLGSLEDDPYGPDRTRNGSEEDEVPEEMRNDDRIIEKIRDGRARRDSNEDGTRVRALIPQNTDPTHQLPAWRGQTLRIEPSWPKDESKFEEMMGKK